MKLEAQRIDITDVETALRLANLNLPAGVIKLGGEEFLLRTRSEFSAAEEVATVTLRAGSGGRRVRIGDVATVTDGFEDRTVTSLYNGEPAITKREDGNTLDIARGGEEVLEAWRGQLPAGITLEIANDQSEQIGEVLGVLQSNALLGLVLVVLALGLFAGWQGALVAALGIPVTFLLALAAMHWTGQSLNGSTLFGLILVLGMVVDDAVVVLENAFRHLEKGKERAQAVVDGVSQVVSPVGSPRSPPWGFLPLVLMPGTTGKFMRIVPIVVSVVLLASLIESLLILPSHFVDIVHKAPPQLDGPKWWERTYLAVLRRFLRWRYLAVVGSVVLLVASTALIPMIGIDLFGGDEFPTFQVFITMPDGTRLERTEAVLAEYQRHALALPEDELEEVTVNAGMAQFSDEWMFNPHFGQLVVDMVPADERRRSLDEIMNTLREATADIPGPVKVEFSKQEGGPPKEAPVQLMVKGPELDVIAAAAARIEDELRSYPGVQDVTDDLDLTQRELDVVVDREAAIRRGLNATRIARAVGRLWRRDRHLLPPRGRGDRRRGALSGGVPRPDVERHRHAICQPGRGGGAFHRGGAAGGEPGTGHHSPPRRQAPGDDQGQRRPGGDRHRPGQPRRLRFLRRGARHLPGGAPRTRRPVPGVHRIVQQPGAALRHGFVDQLHADVGPVQELGAAAVDHGGGAAVVHRRHGWSPASRSRSPPSTASWRSPGWRSTTRSCWSTSSTRRGEPATTVSSRCSKPGASDCVRSC